MRSKDLTLSASLMALYVAIIIIGSTTPFKITGLMLSALFGIFWNYFSLKQNLTFQAGRFAYNVSQALYFIPKTATYVKIQSIAGLAFLEWVNSTGYPTDSAGLELLRITGRVDLTIAFFAVFLIVSLTLCLIMPYAFFRYFKRIGIFKRLPSF